MREKPPRAQPDCADSVGVLEDAGEGRMWSRVGSRGGPRRRGEKCPCASPVGVGQLLEGEEGGPGEMGCTVEFLGGQGVVWTW